jgi:hypothetical protein
VQALELSAADAGSEVSYGPGMMFSGVLAEVQVLAGPWFRNSTRGIIEWTAPHRVFLRTADGRCASLALTEEVTLRVIVENEGESG